MSYVVPGNEDDIFIFLAEIFFLNISRTLRGVRAGPGHQGTTRQSGTTACSTLAWGRNISHSRTASGNYNFHSNSTIK